MVTSDPSPDTLEEFWEQEWDPDRSDDDSMSRRRLLGAAGSLLGLGAMLGGGLLFTTGTARADVATGGLSIGGDSAVSDGGQLSSLTVSISSGHVSYDGLDVDADSLNINFYAVHSGTTPVNADANLIDSTTVATSSDTSMGSRAGHYDYTFSGVNVFNSGDIARSDFHVTADGTTQDFPVDFMVELEVLDASSNVLVSATELSTATISVTNQSRSAGANGNGNTSANGSNQNA